MKTVVGVIGFLALVWWGANSIQQAVGERSALSLQTSLTQRQFDAAAKATPAPAAPESALPASKTVAAGSRAGRELLLKQNAEYRARRPKSPLELQEFRRATSIPVRGTGERKGTAVLIDLNPRINDWYVLDLHWNDGEKTRLHLENARPGSQRLVLDPAFPSGLVVVANGRSDSCDLWSDRSPDRLKEIARDRNPYTELCGGGVLVRRRTQGARTAREWATDFLRRNVRGGEELTVLARKTVYGDAFLENAEVATGGSLTREPADQPAFPRPALVAEEQRNDRLVSGDLGVSVSAEGAMVAGRWYPAIDTPGVFVSLMTAGRVSPEVLEKSRVRNLDVVEKNALIHLIAFDLSRFDIAFALGTDHPGVGWSERVLASVRVPALPGPDGFANLAPLEPTGMVPPQASDRVVATFAGGFKRLHGAFHGGALARVNSGSHYGFVEGGTVLSKLQPGLSTLFTLDDGTVEMKTWSREDDRLLERVRSARQNGVPILERDSQTGEGVPGALVGRWTEGNWGGSQDSKLRSLRAGAALQDSAGRRFLIYAYFSSATPSAMALVFGALGCEYAMHLDMNAPEHTYFALYRSRGAKLEIEHLVRDMKSLDKTSGGIAVPRFLGFADNRDFFYVMRKRNPPETGGESETPSKRTSLP